MVAVGTQAAVFRGEAAAATLPSRRLLPDRPCPGMALLAPPVGKIVGFREVLVQIPLIPLGVPIGEHLRIEERRIIRGTRPCSAAVRAERPAPALAVHFIGGGLPNPFAYRALPSNALAGGEADVFRRDRVFACLVALKDVIPAIFPAPVK